MDCLFCDIIHGKKPCEKLYEDDLVIVIMDLYPYCDGHVLIIPKKHYTDMMDIPNELWIHMMNVCQKMTPILMEKLGKKSMTVSYNYGERQRIKHFHIHLLPNINDGVHKTVQQVYEQLKED